MTMKRCLISYMFSKWGCRCFYGFAIAWLGVLLSPVNVLAETSPQVDNVKCALDIRIKEFMPRPETGQKEWVDIYNFGATSINLTSWKIDDIEEGSKPKDIWGILEVGSCGHFEFSGFNDSGGDSVRVLNAEGLVVCTLDYKNTRKGYSILLNGDEWKFSDNPAIPSCPVLEKQIEQEEEGNEEEVEEVEEEEVNYPDNVKITEFMACPEKDEEEWVEIYNDTGEDLDLTAWKIDDVVDGGASPYTLDEDKIGKSLTVKKEKYFVIFFSSSRFNNTGGDSVRLLNPNNEVVDETSYEDCQTGYSYALDDSGDFKLTQEPTPGEENEIVNGEVEEEKEEGEVLNAEDVLPNDESSGQVLSASFAKSDIKIPDSFEIKEGVSEFVPSAQNLALDETVSEVVNNKNSFRWVGFVIIFPAVFAGIIVMFRKRIYGLWKNFKSKNP